MADTKYFNKVVYGGQTLIDLTSDDVTASTLLSGTTAHDASGAPITGTCTYDVDSQDATAQVAELLTGKTAYARGAKITGTMPNRGAQTATISTKTGSVTINQGYHDGSGKITISTTEQAKIIAANIKQGVTILGVTGSLEPSSNIKAHAKTATPSTSSQTILPDAGFDYLSQVTVEAIPYVETQNAAGGYTATIG